MLLRFFSKNRGGGYTGYNGYTSTPPFRNFRYYTRQIYSIYTPNYTHYTHLSIPNIHPQVYPLYTDNYTRYTPLIIPNIPAIIYSSIISVGIYIRRYIGYNLGCILGILRGVYLVYLEGYFGYILEGIMSGKGPQNRHLGAQIPRSAAQIGGPLTGHGYG